MVPGTLHDRRESIVAAGHEEVDDDVLAPVLPPDSTAALAGFTAPPELPSIRGALRDLRSRVTWDQRHARLATHPLMAGLRRSEIRRWARAAEEVEFDPGEVILRQNGIGYWLILILSGSATRLRGGQEIGRVGAGEHLGELAAFGGRPQFATVIAETPVRAFVLGRQRVACLVHDQPIVQRRLFPDLHTKDFVGYVRGLRAEAAAEWRAVGPLPRRVKGGRATIHLQVTRPGRPVARDAAWPGFGAGLLPRGLLPRGPSQRGPADDPRPLSWRARAAIAAICMLAIAVVAALYHPPMIVVTAVHPIDVSDDIVVTGVPVHPVHGRYLLLAVRFDRPNAFGALEALVSHRHRLSVGTEVVSAADRLEAERQAEQVFRRSQEDAAAAAARTAGIATHLSGTGAIVLSVLDPATAGGVRAGDVIVAVGSAAVRVAPDVTRLITGPASSVTVERNGRRVAVTGPVPRAADVPFVLTTRDPTYTLPFRVTFRHRAIGGPSAGLIYALALSDMLGSRDIAQGRTIAATGAIDPAGQVGPIGFAPDKCTAARRAHSIWTFVPAGSDAGACAGAAAVRNIDDAIRSLLSPAAG